MGPSITIISLSKLINSEIGIEIVGLGLKTVNRVNREKLETIMC